MSILIRKAWEPQGLRIKELFNRMATIPINIRITFEQPFITGLVTLDGRQFRLRIDHSSRRVGAEGLEPMDPQDPERARRTLATFRMTWQNSAGTTLISGLRIKLGTDRLRLYKYNPAVPQGSLDIVAVSDMGFEPTRGIPAQFSGTQGIDFGHRVLMQYVEPPATIVPIIPITLGEP